MFLPALTGFTSSTKRVKFESAGSIIVTPPLATTVTIDGVTDLLPSRPNSLLMVWVYSYNNGTNSDTTGVSRNAQALTSLGATVGGNNDLRFSLWYRLNPSSTDGTGIIITQDAAYVTGSRVAISWAYLYNVNQTVPLNPRANNTSNAANPTLTASPTLGAINTFPIAGFAGADTAGGLSWDLTLGQTRLTSSAIDDIIATGIDTETPSAASSFSVTGRDMTTPLQSIMISTNVNPA